jgi:6-pyruvoyltetrahydropterin/6-carboxytetrahydropterin synthase
MYEITVEAQFSAAHRLREYKGPCEHIHGHNWLVRASVRCEELDKSGIGIDFRVLKGKLREIIEGLDHKDLNAILAFNPSSENISRYVYEQLAQSLSDWNGTVSRVEVHETPGNCAAYFV